MPTKLKIKIAKHPSPDAALAAKEIRSISENVTWRYRKRFADGKVTILYGGFLGYDRGDDGASW